MWLDWALCLCLIGDAVFSVVVLLACTCDMVVEGVTLAPLMVLVVSDGGGVGVLLSSYR